MAMRCSGVSLRTCSSRLSTVVAMTGFYQTGCGLSKRLRCVGAEVGDGLNLSGVDASKAACPLNEAAQHLLAAECRAGFKLDGPGTLGQWHERVLGQTLREHGAADG